MGNVKDSYFKYADNGDQYVGRCLSLLPVLNVDLAVSPPYFSDVADSEWIREMISVQFHGLGGGSTIWFIATYVLSFVTSPLTVYCQFFTK
jgi:hypothetical protein